MHPVRRRKKRPNNGIRTIEVCRGNNGFGFTISGQQPCILSCIVRDSPAERAGLRSGDYLVAVNGQNVSKVSHDDVVRLIGCSSGLLKLQIAENYYSDSSDEDHVVTVRSKPKHAHKVRGGNGAKAGGQQNRVAKVVRDLRTGAMFDKYGVEIPSGQEAWELPALPPPRLHLPHSLGAPKEELCFFLGYLGTIEMPKLIQPGSRSQVVRCCVKRLRAEKRSHTWVVMRVHAEGVTLTGAGGALLADYPVHRICYCGPSADDDRKYVGLVTAVALEDGDASPSSSCHIFAVQSSLADHDKHVAKVASFKINCTTGPLSDGCFEFPSTSEPVLNAVRSFCLTKDEEHHAFDNELLLANSPQPSQAGSTAASSNSDSGIGFRDDCGNQSDRIVMVDIENQRLHIQQLCDDGKTLDIQLAGARGLDAPSANLQQAFACVSALCPLPGDLDPAALGGYAELSQRLAVRAVSTPGPSAARSRSPLNSSDEGATHRSIGRRNASVSCVSGQSKQFCDIQTNNEGSTSQNGAFDQSVFYRLGLLPDLTEDFSMRQVTKSSENLESCTSNSLVESFVARKSSKSYDNLYYCSDDYKLSPQVHSKPYNSRTRDSPLSVSYGAGDMVLRDADATPYLSYSMSPRFSLVGSPEVCRSRSIYFQSAENVDVQSYKLSPKVFGVPRPLVTQSLEELASPPPPPPPQLWGSLQDLPFHSMSNVTEAIEDKDGKEDGKDEDGAPCWAASFEKLVDDPQGLHAFTEFLKKEFSQENMTFWCACAAYERATDASERRRLARAIFAAHLAEGAPEPVNVDAHARQHALNLDAAPIDLFAAAQKQVFNLMKFDSYPRFLKSDIYQEYVGKSRKLKKSRSDAEDRRRKSLLPWARKSRSKSKDRGESELSLSLQRKGSEDAVSVSSRSSLASWDLALRGSFSRQSCTSRDGDGALVRVVLADGATAVVQLRDGETVRGLMERVLTKRGLSYNAFEVFTTGKPIPLDDDSSSLANHEVRLEQRVLFRLDLPNRKTVSVKAKTTKTLGEVLRPVLHKYNYPLEMVTICSMSENEVLELSAPISSADGRRLTVLTRSAEVWRGEPPLPPPAPPKTFVKPARSLDEITNKVFEEVLHCKSSGGSSAAGSVRSDASSATLPLPLQLPLPLPRFLRRESALTADKLRLRGRKPGKPAGTAERSDSDDLYEDLKRAQSSRLEDQRGTEINYELPDFLKDKENSPAGVRKMRKLLQEGKEIQDDDVTQHGSLHTNGDVKASLVSNVSSRPLDRSEEQPKDVLAVTCKTYETVPMTKQTPPPLPPKPKLYRLPQETALRNHNFVKPSDVKSFAKLNRSRRAAYLEEPSSSFV